MENAAEALKMAGAVLLFLIAISVSIISFGNVREAADTILEYKDRETAYIDGEYYYSQSTENEREVGLETILPTLSRVYTENYKVVLSKSISKKLDNKTVNLTVHDKEESFKVEYDDEEFVIRS